MKGWGLKIRMVAAETKLESGKRVEWRGGNWAADSLTMRSLSAEVSAMFSAFSNDRERWSR